MQLIRTSINAANLIYYQTAHESLGFMASVNSSDESAHPPSLEVDYFKSKYSPKLQGLMCVKEQISRQ